jgi:hypothetical protein
MAFDMKNIGLLPWVKAKAILMQEMMRAIILRVLRGSSGGGYLSVLIRRSWSGIFLSLPCITSTNFNVLTLLSLLRDNSSTSISAPRLLLKGAGNHA